MKYINLLKFGGNLGAKPEIKVVNTQNGETKVAKFQIITNKSKKDDSTGKWETTLTQSFWFSAWGKNAEMVEKMDKGDPILVFGDPITKEVEKEGKRNFYTTVQCSEIYPISKSITKSVSNYTKESDPNEAPPDQITADNLPF